MEEIIYPNEKTRVLSASWVYKLAVLVNRVFFSATFRTEVYGEEIVLSEKSFILASNHASFLDPPLVGCFLDRPICYFARDTLFVGGGVGTLLKALYAIPIKRDAATDVKGMKLSFQVLKGGSGLLIFPEGTRTEDGDFQEAKAGVGMFACRTGTTVLPARIWGTYKAYGKGMKFFQFAKPIRLVYGKPVQAEEFDPGKTDENRYEEASRRIMEKIKAIRAPYQPAV